MNHTPEPWHLLDDRWLAAGTSPGQPYIADAGVRATCAVGRAALNQKPT